MQTRFYNSESLILRPQFKTVRINPVRASDWSDTLPILSNSNKTEISRRNKGSTKLYFEVLFVPTEVAGIVKHTTIILVRSSTHFLELHCNMPLFAARKKFSLGFSHLRHSFPFFKNKSRVFIFYFSLFLSPCLSLFPGLYFFVRLH